MAEDHALARRVSIPSYLYEQLLQGEDKKKKDPQQPLSVEVAKPVNLCDCCGCPMENKQLPLCSSRYELFFLGSGFPLFFDFIVWGLGMMLMIFVISSIFGLGSNSKVKDNDPEKSWFVELSLANSNDKIGTTSQWKEAQMIVNFFTILLLLIYLQFFRRAQRKTAFECDFKNLTPSDYTVKVSGLPLNFLDYELKEHFKKVGGTELNVNVVKINKTYAIGQYIKLMEEKTKMLNEKRNLQELLNYKTDAINSEATTQKVKNTYKGELDGLNKKIADKSELLEKLEEKVKNERITLIKTYVKFTGTAYVTFETPEQARFVKRKLKKTFKQKMNMLFNKGYQFDPNHFYQGKRLIYAERAPEPNDIIWENLGTDWIVKFKLQWWTAFYTFLILVACFFAIFGLTFLQKFLTAKDNAPDSSPPPVTNTNLKNFINALGAILISVIKKFASLEKHLTHTGYDSSVASKKVIAQFLNTAIIYIIISWLKQSWTDSSGLIDQLLNICISTLIVNSALYSFDPLYLLRLYQRRKVRKEGAKSMMTQSEAHALFEDPTLDIPNLYSGVLNVMLFSAFYATLQPMVVLFGIITLAAFYWIFKIMLIRRSSIPVELGKKIAYDMVEIAEYIPLAMSLGDVLFNVKFYEYANPWSITACCLCFVNFIVPMSWVNKQIFDLDEKHKLVSESADFRKDFTSARPNFTFEYDRLNPITQQKAVEEWVNFIEKKPTIEEATSAKQKDFAKGLFSTLKKQTLASQELESKLEENKTNEEEQEEEKEQKEEKIEGISKKNNEGIENTLEIERKATDEDSKGLENYFLFNKAKGKKVGDKGADVGNLMYPGQKKPVNLFGGILQGKK